MNINDYRNLLAVLGIDAEIDTLYSYRLNATFRERNFVFEHDENTDPFYFRIVLPNVATINDGATLDLLNEFNVKFKATKIIMQNNSFHIVSEQYIFNTGTIESVTQRIIDILTTEITEFHQSIINSHVQNKPQ